MWIIRSIYCCRVISCILRSWHDRFETAISLLGSLLSTEDNWIKSSDNLIFLFSIHRCASMLYMADFTKTCHFFPDELHLLSWHQAILVWLAEVTISKQIVSKHCQNTYILKVKSSIHNILSWKWDTFIMYPNVTISAIVQICLVVTIAHLAINDTLSF